MRTLLPIAALLAGLTSTAYADTSHDSPAELQMRAAERQAQADSDTARSEAELTVIADRDLTAARLRVSTSSFAWQKAIKANRVADAGNLAREHQAALAAEREAEGNYELHRAGRDLARADFQRDAQLIRMCEQRLRKLSARR